MSFSFTEEIDEWLEKMSEATGATKAGVLRAIVRKAIKEKKDGEKENVDNRIR